MATNIVYELGNQVRVACSYPTTPTSGAPVLVGQCPGVALTNEDADGLTTVKTDGFATLSVKGENHSGNNAVALGDVLYLDTVSGHLNKDTTDGVRFGYAWAAVTSGATATILVKIGY